MSPRPSADLAALVIAAGKASWVRDDRSDTTCTQSAAKTRLAPGTPMASSESKQVSGRGRPESFQQELKSKFPAAGAKVIL